MLSRLILLIAFIVIALIVIQLFRNTPKAQLKQVYWKYGLAIAALVLVLLAVTGRIHWIGAAIGAALPFIRRSLPLILRFLPTIQHLYKTRTQPPPASDNQSQVNTRILSMVMNHDNNRLSGEVISGPFSGQQLDGMELSNLEQLLDYCHQQDTDSARLLITYLNHRFGADWQQQSTAPPPSSNGEMDEDAAYAVLGLIPGASKEDIVAAHRRMMQKMHPDRGGSDYLAAQINQAKDLLLKKVA